MNINPIIISCLTNYGAGLVNKKIRHEDVLLNANRFKKKFNSNFFLTDTVFWLLIGQAMMIGSIFGLNNTTDTFTELLTFSASWGGISWIFYWGLILLLIGWIINIRRSSLGWGIFQNIVQGAVVLVFSVILAIGALLLLDKLKKK